MNTERHVTEHHHNPVFGTPPIIGVSREEAERAQEQYDRSKADARREAGARDMALARAMNPLRVRRDEPPPLKAPALPDGFDAAEIDRAIFERGVAIDRDRLVSLGRDRFDDLLLLDHRARQSQRVIATNTDLSSWESVKFAFRSVNAFDVAGVPARKTAEISAGMAKDREAARTITGFVDLWKLFEHEPQTVRCLYAFHDAFARLAFGQSVLERIESDGRLRSRFFCGGSGERVTLFNGWLSALQSEHFGIPIERPLGAVMRWLCGEKTPLPEPKQQARAWFGIRHVEPVQMNIAPAVIEGFLLDFRDWALWQHVGRVTRQRVEVDRLESWRKELARGFPAIWNFLETLRGFFLRQVGGNPYETHLTFDSPRHRAYVEREFGILLDAVSLVAAAETDACAARFADSLLVEGKPKPSLADKIGEKLARAFGGSEFNVVVEEIA
jgi:hypothetical protein